MPVYDNADSSIKSMKGIHVYHYFLTPHAVNLFTQENTTGLIPAQPRLAV